MWLHPVGANEDVQTYISPKLCLTPEIKSKYFRTGECVGIGLNNCSSVITEDIYLKLRVVVHYLKGNPYK